MPFLPSTVIGMWLRGLLAIAILAGSALLFVRWAQELPAPIEHLSPARHLGILERNAEFAGTLAGLNIETSQDRRAAG